MQFLKNYKTTLCGLALAVVQAISTYNGHGGVKGYLSAVGIAAFGFLAKDAL
jgi:hypothetical protein